MTIDTLIRLLLVYVTIGCSALTENMSLYQRELNAMPVGLHMLGENGTLVEITIDEGQNENTLSRRFFHHPNTFNLYTRRNPKQSQILSIGNIESLRKSYFNRRRPTRFITHGWISSQNDSACTLIRDGELIPLVNYSAIALGRAYLAKGRCNVIVFDWSGMAYKPYTWVSNKLSSVSLEVAKMIDFLVDYGRMKPNRTTLVGHSLGAHLMGLAGYNSKYQIRNLVGLDPARPMFQFTGPGSGISKMDANHVQIIHTNGGCLGSLKAIGHTDFYPNGGIKQPGCFLLDLLACSCSHQRAYYMFAESITTPKPFYGYRCKSYVNYLTGNCSKRSIAPMGGAILNFTKPGKYYLSTGSKPPFSNLK